MKPHDPRCVAGPPLSPCNRVCRLDPASGLCVGCQRTGDEIAAWWRLRDDEKRAVLAALPQRRVLLGGSEAPGSPLPRQPG